MAQFRSDKFLADRANWDLKAHLSENAYFGNNLLISNQTANMQSACNLHNSIRGVPKRVS
ncbi:hypothetical protein XBKB1_4180010 [Xenorhabdus bovienii str. kraussei Becker Underwood]|uniref:Uncharacterized protein n=1 Tax=Xenorhabdus bovienii str. kraussei Becker Underwood TaxID=1398204 RepID=A0A077Q193_XENBV|nr:hypothetical protein XBKB1_4180010 [Xenorhabdus bovienii str. kraussei Becker Underwood]